MYLIHLSGNLHGLSNCGGGFDLRYYGGHFRICNNLCLKRQEKISSNDKKHQSS